MSSQESISLPKARISKEEYAGIFVRFLAQGNYKAAAQMAWPWFQQNEWTDKIWVAIEKYDRLCIMGHGSASKTFTASVWFLLDWLAYTDKTALILTSATIPSMDRRIWADFKTLWTKSKIDLSSVASILDAKRMIRQSVSEGKAAVHAVAAESEDAETKIQGMHMPRNRVIIDEADNPYSSSIWPALVNLGTSGHLKWVALANPTDKNSEFGFHCEPRDGWDSINPEIDFEWTSKLDCHVMRLDGLQSPNILAGEDKYPFLLNNESVARTRETSGTNSPEWWTMIRAFYAPEGLSANIFPGGLVSRSQKPILWYGETIDVAACDPAFEGGDSCILTVGKMGRVAENPQRTALEVSEAFIIKRKDTTKTLAFDYAEQIVTILKDRKVLPENFGIDTTGTQGPFADIIEESFGKGIVRVNFGGAATNKKITAEDKSPAVERYKNFVTELWYVAREWCRLGLVYFKDPHRDLRIQLESRQYHLKGKHAKSGREVIQAETKLEMKARGLRSPDCFIAGTMVLTDKGEKPIEKIKVGDLIQTPLGLSPVTFIHKTQTKKLTHVTFSNGKSLTGKGKHKIFTWDKGWVRLDALCLTNHLESAINLRIWNFLNLLFSTNASIGFKNQADIIPMGTSLRMRDFYIELSGRSTMGIFQMVLKSIIKMAIGQITESRTWSFLRGFLTTPCTCVKDLRILSSIKGIWNISKGLLQRLLNGIGLQRVKRGTKCTEKIHGKIGRKTSNAPALNVEANLMHGCRTQQFAQRDAGIKEPAKKIRFKELVWFVVKNLRFSNTSQLKLVHAPVELSLAGKVDVYNLTLLNHNVYYANGVLVQNCADSFCILCHLVRMKAGGFIPGTFADETPKKVNARWKKNSSTFTMNYGVDDK